ncbi:MAG: hypothetical protein EOM21_17745 [Gammaproteobacteria bacterium]|nr:hypothetical protein [Gammaproteobacteria bacterium]
MTDKTQAQLLDAEARVIEVTVKATYPRNMGDGNDDRITLLSTKSLAYIINDDAIGQALKPGDRVLMECRGRYSTILAVINTK